MKELKEPSSILVGMSEHEMLALMERLNIACRVENFREALKDAQRRALEQAKREAALTEMVRESERLGAYELEEPK